ncbi:hypothetical protein [Streptococcus uberis]|uniref:hypothetical protein n=1 Tax=Streptococcus uberis TaxID=1349 RepID=UPI0020BF832B|nr:hypothetical protein [Streptococcus uberis]
MAYSNKEVYETIIEIQDSAISKLQRCLSILVCLFFIAIGTILATSYHYNNQIEVKDKQIDGLHGQLRRTQYQLKKASEQNIEQTNKIAELTGNGG